VTSDRQGADKVQYDITAKSLPGIDTGPEVRRRNAYIEADAKTEPPGGWSGPVKFDVFREKPVAVIVGRSRERQQQAGGKNR